MSGDMRLDGYPTDEDAAAGYMSHVGFFRLALDRAIKALDHGAIVEARWVLANAEATYRDDANKRHERIAPALAAAGLVRGPHGGIVAAEPEPTP